MKSVRAGEQSGEVCVGVSQSNRVNQVDKGLGQPRQVMTAGTHGPSGQPIFDLVAPCI